MHGSRAHARARELGDYGEPSTLSDIAAQCLAAHRSGLRPDQVLPLKERRMHAARGRSRGDVLRDLRIRRGVAGDHQHDVVHRDGAERPARQQRLEDRLRLALGNGRPVTQRREQALRVGIVRAVVAGDVVRAQRADAGDADRLAAGRGILLAVVGVQAVRLRHREPAVGEVALAIARRRDEHAHDLVDIAGEGARERVVVQAPGRHVVERPRRGEDRGDRIGAEARDRDGQARVGVAVLEARVQAFEDAPLVGGEGDGVEDLQPGRQGGPGVAEGGHGGGVGRPA